MHFGSSASRLGCAKIFPVRVSEIPLSRAFESEGRIHGPTLHYLVISRDVPANPTEPGSLGDIVLDLLTEQDVAKLLHVSLASLRRWRLLDRGPRFIKVGALVRYRPEDLEAWLAGQPIGGSGPERREIRLEATSDRIRGFHPSAY